MFRKVVNWSRGIPLPILLVPCCIASFIVYEYQVRLGYFGLHRSDYRKELVTIVGYNNERRKQRGGKARYEEQLRVQTSFGVYIADPQSIDYRKWWPVWTLEDLKRDFPVGQKLEVLVKRPTPFFLQEIHPFILSASYGETGSIGLFLKIIFLNLLLCLWLVAWVDRVLWRKRARYWKTLKS